MKNKLKWLTHEDMAIELNPSILRDEYLDFMTFKENKRMLFTELFGPLVGLKEEWEAQGATIEELDFSAFKYLCPETFYVPVNTGRIGYFLKKINETEEEILYVDDIDRTMMLKKGIATIPLPINYPVQTMDDWLKIKSKYIFSEERFDQNWQNATHKAFNEGKIITVTIPGGFSAPRELLGDENLCFAYYDQPELIKDILYTIGQTAYDVLERVSGEVQVDELAVGEDLAGKSGPLIGPKEIEEFIKPYYRKIWDLLESRGAKIFNQDSDGNLNSVIEAFLEAGVNMMHPMEPAAGMDIVTLREKYGNRLAFAGGIDKHVIRRSKDEIIKELEYKIPPMVKTGGCILSLDHRIPNGTPLENYKFYIEKVWEIIKYSK